MEAVGDLRIASPVARGRRWFLALALALATLAVVPAVVPATSHASAGGYEYWGAFVWKDIPIAKGQLYHYISGKGQHISWEAANFGSVGNLCDTSVKFTWGYGAQSYAGNIHTGCSHVGQWKYSFNRNVPRGSACAELWMHGWRKMVARQCHFVS